MKKSALIFLLFSASCISPRVSVTNVTSPADNLIIHGKLFATAYQQRAAEYRALCYQAYNIARWRVEQNKSVRNEKPKAIMTDVDETVLNNSPYQARQVLSGKDYDPASWYDWTSRGEADTVPGALRFFQFAASAGIEIFYVTNRLENEREGTLKNLQKFNFPNADNEHLLLKSDVSSKEKRRQDIAATHSIILLIGDNLNDVNSLFEKKNVDERMKVADSFAAEFGDRFIILPNPVYGDWESSLYNFNNALTGAQKDSVFRASLHGY
jgi:5'-nucleotidase (lipoprotein e(P4) family)